MERPATCGPVPVPVMSGPVLLVLAVMTALAPLSVDIYTPSLPRIQADLGGSDWLAQASITACLLGIGIGQLLWGTLSDRLGRRPVVLWGVAGWTLASLLSGFATTSMMLVVARGVAGLCGAAGIVAARSVVRDLSTDSVSVASRVGLLSLVTAIAPIIAPVAGTGIAVLWGWRADFPALVVLGALVSVAFAVLVPETLPSRARVRGSGVLAGLALALRDRELVGVAAAMAVYAFGFYAYVSTMSFVVEREFGYPPAVFALVFGVNATMMFCANLMFRRLVRTHHPYVPQGIGLGLGVVGGTVLMAAAVLHAPVALIWLGSTIFAVSAGFVLPGTHAWGQLTAVASGAASALTGSAQFLGGVLGSPVTGIVGPTAAHLGALIALGSVLGLHGWNVGRRARRCSVVVATGAPSR